jgi:hypothetical protein
MNRTDEYRQKAEDCRRFAEQSANPEQKAFWLHAAEDWIKLADLSQATHGIAASRLGAGRNRARQ